MNLLGTQIIETKRIVLRKLVIEDAENIFKNWASLEETMKYLPWEPSKSIEQVKVRLQNWINLYSNNTFFQWGIELKSSKELIGIINLHEVDVNNQSAETSYILAKKYWNKGFMTEALQAVLNFGFEDIGLNRINAEYYDGNISSEKVMLKNNLQYEGVAKEKYLKKGKFYNAIQYALTKKEWEKWS
ncbi:GNAT family N-acetyltransferase [Haloimpatiens sp. FM7330]|uniref:GNAT family N-acetyltransferase n=1 Tax=Haloimpatiens sp. FM7330 TaxID=3298610 RepID=UPI0036327BB7